MKKILLLIGFVLLSCSANAQKMLWRKALTTPKLFSASNVVLQGMIPVKF